jgi:hypothetical protein
MQDLGPIILFTYFVCREFLRLGTSGIVGTNELTPICRTTPEPVEW